MKQQEPLQTKSDIIYFIKGIAIISVVCAHCTIITTDTCAVNVWLAQMLNFWGILGVPFLFGVSGYLFGKNTKSFGQFWINKFKSVIVPWLVCETVLWFYVAIRKGGISFCAWLSFIVGIDSTAYYLTVLMELYLVFLLIPKGRGIYVCMGISLLNLTATCLNINPLNKYVHSYYLNPLNWMLFFAIGLLIRRRRADRELRSKGEKRNVSIMGTLLYLLYAVWYIRTGFPVGYFVMLTPANLAVSAIFVMGNALCLKRGKLFRLLGLLGKYSYTIYLTHQLFVGLICWLTNKIDIPGLVLMRPAIVIGIVLSGIGLLRLAEKKGYMWSKVIMRWVGIRL